MRDTKIDKNSIHVQSITLNRKQMLTSFSNKSSQNLLLSKSCHSIRFNFHQISFNFLAYARNNGVDHTFPNMRRSMRREWERRAHNISKICVLDFCRVYHRLSTCIIVHKLLFLVEYKTDDQIQMHWQKMQKQVFVCCLLYLCIECMSVLIACSVTVCRNSNELHTANE